MLTNPEDTLERQVEKLNKIVRSLMQRVEQSTDMGATPYALFQTAITLENRVNLRTADLQKALDDLGKTHGELSRALDDAEVARQNLLDALEAMSEGFALFSQDQLVICNDRFRQLLPDVSERITEGMSFGDYTHVVAQSGFLEVPDGQSRAEWEAFRKARHGRRQATFVVHLQGDRWIQVSDRSMEQGRTAILHTDITEMVREQRLQRDQILGRQARMVRATIDHMSQGICTFDAQHLLVTSNSRFRELLSLPFQLTQDGAALDEILRFLEVDILDGRLLRRQLIPWLHRSDDRATLELEVRRSDGLIMTASCRRLPDGGFVASFTDVTEERRAAEALARSKATLELRVAERTSALTDANQELVSRSQQQERAEAEMRAAKEAAEAANLSKTRFLAAASHDLLQPLNAAKLFISNLQATDLEEGQAAIASSLKRSFNSVESILDALLDISRLDASGAEFTVQPFALNRIFESLKEEFELIAAAKGLEFAVVPTSLVVQSDMIYLQRIIRNLMSNAVKYTPRGKILLGCRHRGDEVVIGVMDTGPGIADSDMSRIFEEFQRLECGGPEQDQDQGMGLGLSFVERACRQLGHRLDLVSQVGRGTGFFVAVPRADREQPPAAQDAEERQPGDAIEFDALVALVENDQEVMSAMVGTLERWGISVIPATSTEALLAAVAEVGVPPDVIIADYHLNGSDTGLRSIAALREAAGQRIPGILVTADRSKQLQRGARQMEVEVLTKPLKPQALRSLLGWTLR